MSDMNEEMQILFDNYTALMDGGQYLQLKQELNEEQPANIAEYFEELTAEKQLFIFRLLSKDVAAEVFSYMDNDTQEHIVQSITDREVRNIVDEMFLDDTVDFLEEAPANLVKKVLRNTDAGTRQLINRFLNYPENSAGSLMTIEFVRLRANMTVAKALSEIKRVGMDKETIYTCYVLDKDRTLLGIVTVKDLLLAESDDTEIREIMTSNIISVTTQDDQEEVAKMFSKYNFLALPVVDTENRMVGIVTFDDAMDVMEEEATEDMEIMAAMTPSEKSYLKSSPFELYKHRIPWLMLLMVSATFTGMIISSFESALTKLAALTAFIPMLMDTGGNCGSQSSVTVIRALSLDELEFSDALTVLWKEIRTAVLCGITLAAVCFLKVLLVDRLLMGNASISLSVDLVICLALGVTVIMAKMVGCTLPLLAKKLGFDPAVMASPFITTIVDALSLLVYFLFAKTILGL